VTILGERAPQSGALKLWGSAELCQHMGISRETLRKWKQKDGFPQPLASLSMGPVWDAEQVKQWKNASS
jgi:predicted DNA-binding transcriptional regulator AlpA